MSLRLSVIAVFAVMFGSLSGLLLSQITTPIRAKVTMTTNRVIIMPLTKGWTLYQETNGICTLSSNNIQLQIIVGQQK